MSQLTRDEWVPAINQRLMDCQDCNQVLMALRDIIDLRKFEGVIPYCADAARYKMQQMDRHPGLTTVVDGEGVMHAAGFAVQKVEDTASCMLDLLRKIWKATRPVHLIVAFDDDRRIRREMFAEFKADRKPNPRKEAIDAIKPSVIQAMRDNKIQVEIAEGYEADDVLASVASQCQILGTECVMATEDKDCWQALGPKTTIYSRKNDAFYGVPWLKTNHKISPQQAIDWLVLVGKNGMPHPKGIGAETASDLLEAYGTFQGILDSDKITPAKRTAMEAVDYWKLREAHTLNRSLPIGRAKYSQNDEVRC